MLLQIFRLCCDVFPNNAAAAVLSLPLLLLPPLLLLLLAARCCCCCCYCCLPSLLLFAVSKRTLVNVRGSPFIYFHLPRNLNAMPCTPFPRTRTLPNFFQVCLRQGERFDPHPNITRNLVCYGTVTAPATGQQGEMFFIMSPDLGHGGELFE